MNTTKKGNAFEDRVAQMIQRLLNEDEFYVPGKKSQVFRKKAYYSFKRKNDIIFDVTVETRLKPDVPYSILSIIECKHYNHRVTVDDVEEFESKIRQIGEHDTKGIIVTNNQLQSGALELAKSLKIGVVRLDPNDEYQWINYRHEKKGGLDLQRLADYFYTTSDKLPKFIGYLNGILFDGLPDALIESGIIDIYRHKEKFISVPFLTDERIENIVDRLYNHDINNGQKLSIEKLAAFLISKYPFVFEIDDEMPYEKLGSIDFESEVIRVNPRLRDDPHRWRFTFAHEVGHMILHRKLLEGAVKEKNDDEATLEVLNPNYMDNERRIEIQANLFASTLLLPRPKLENLVNRFFKENGIHKGYLFVDSQPVNQVQALNLLKLISETFDVSLAVGRIRLIKLKLAVYKNDGHIGNIVRDYFK
ncbi:ImmA/IrrE family metallo-endopeptidase [Mucilaginibacter sp. cycad4]|uniref:ImmA/IrrE family metallo-endopeptidase n=1 Tax=Mucilaginibacter sp. cycad4 TaxID=3342096 RepID=UPI002AAC097E|nr:ImmA/IrrE family metallo-endopeptidase [Mucilaginibacter gossypii]WPV00886.1 ImmA/IrrE family metallo-endopeptidase [Mucilaginibacter gossypii]